MGKLNVVRNGRREPGTLARDMEASMVVMLLTEEVGRVVREAGSAGAMILGEDVRRLADAIAAEALPGRMRGRQVMAAGFTASRVRLAELEARMVVAAQAGWITQGRLKTILSIISVVRRHCLFGCDEQFAQSSGRWLVS